jgi:hypothetical protein
LIIGDSRTRVKERYEFESDRTVDLADYVGSMWQRINGMKSQGATWNVGCRHVLDDFRMGVGAASVRHIQVKCKKAIGCADVNLLVASWNTRDSMDRLRGTTAQSLQSP